MIFQKNIVAQAPQEEITPDNQSGQNLNDDVETVVGPSVNVEGDLSSAGNIIVKGSVSGSVSTSKLLTVEKGAKITASVKAGSAVIAGEVKGNMKIKDSLELTSSSRVLGDICVKTLRVEDGAVIYGKVTMPGVEDIERRTSRLVKKIKKDDLDEAR
ncbi:MAG: hypothetical protein COU31_00340 [Candidatus Magasanikbacteria bacterium CG10_big_fil_rev_8_21_14_0_10_40_10]|uniref:Cell shape determination protein CcmA n=1 Tax=Candidatus Magasanikbacteria bacterium CG10_big_fil_rev_8_21_14_0_10_40_10 TaxID=1974648 RepID=A0A2M6W5B2_9BACT|nr:MAG: hypothetical protein COU31_00340 [Candidatus Magasanikbacteria bacterium CG10_big_fil_rev_8_21_14_0_10_40_10]